MRRWALVMALLAAGLALGGCTALLERSYSIAEPYTDRYWDSGAEDTLRAENYQDLVNSMLMLIEQGAEEGVIRCYGEASEYSAILSARDEVRWETTLGAYLLRNLRFTFENGTSYSTIACSMDYRADAEDVSAIMTLSDSQSLVDLLRLAVREEHKKLTARFAYDTPREEVDAAVESLWRELCRASMEAESGAEEAGAVLEDGPSGDAAPENAPEPPEEREGPAAPEGEEPGADGETGTEGGEEEVPPEPEYPPCPWTVRFYPNRETAEIVEVLLS